MREYGRITHNGHSFVAQGATVEGNHVTGYQRGRALTTWQGQTMIDCRFFEFETYRRPGDFGDECRAVAWLLPQGRAIVGLSLGDGMLFRGELVRGVSGLDELRILAESEANYWVEIDYEDHVEQELELV